ncbi:MAG: glycosyltransferase family 39 protein [Pseudomonadota bacterium]
MTGTPAGPPPHPPVGSSRSLGYHCGGRRRKLPTVEHYNAFEEIGSAVKGIATRKRACALAVIGLLGFLLIISASWKATPDSALYLELGESLAVGKGFLFNGESHTYVPPGYPGMIALVVTFFGKGFLHYRILMAALGVLTALAGWVLVARLCGRDTAFIAGGLFALNHSLLHNACFTASDVPFAFVCLVGLNALASAAGDKHRVFWTVVSGLLLSLPPLVRVNGWGIPPAAAIFLLAAWKDRSYPERAVWAGAFLVLAIIPGALWVWYKTSFPGSVDEGSYLEAIGGRDWASQVDIIFRSAWGYVSETTEALSGLTIKTGFLELAVPVLVLIGAAAAWFNGERLFVPLTVIQLGGLLLSPAGNRYIIFLLPGLYLFLFLGIERCRQWVAVRMSKHGASLLSGRRLLIGVFIAFALFNVGHNIITIVGARSALERDGAESARDLPFFQAARWLRGNAPGSVVLTMHPRVLHYLSGLRTVELVRSGVPEHQVWVDARDQIRGLIERNDPAFLFSDAKNRAQYRHVMEAIESLDMQVREIEDAGCSTRFRLWRILR